MNNYKPRDEWGFFYVVLYGLFDASFDSSDYTFCKWLSTGLLQQVCYTLCMPTKEQIKKIRNKNGLTQVEFAKAIGVSTVLISMIESGNKPVTRRTLQKIADAFGEKFNITIR
jgi:DNA-binding XRE family transcriptional regulator